MKFTRDQVLETVNKIGRPCTTSDIGEAARVANGQERYRTQAGSGDVSPALAELVADGLLVTAKRPPRGRYGTPEPEPSPHDYLVPPTDRRERWYATPEQAAAFRALLERTTTQNERLEALIAELSERWPGLDRIDRSTGRDRAPAVSIRFTLDQLEWLIELVAKYTPEV